MKVKIHTLDLKNIKNCFPHVSILCSEEDFYHFHYADTADCFFLNDKWKTSMELHVMSGLQDSPLTMDINLYLVFNMTPLKNLLK